jgi:hypothetical protein
MFRTEAVVVGAGVIGLSIARALAARGLEVLVLESEPGIGQGISSRNSEVIHAGLYYAPGSLKARLCVVGRRALYQYCADRNVPHRRCGKLVVATTPEEDAALVAIKEQAEANAPTIGQAHERALKGAETDATKRALATFGNPFGLALYDREQTRVRHYPSKPIPDQVANGPWMLRSAAGDGTATFDNPDRFGEALCQAMTKAESIEILFAVWEQNLATLRSLSYNLKQNGKLKTDFGKNLLAHLKSCAVALVNPEPKSAQHETEVMAGKVKAGCKKNVSTAAPEK